MTTEEIVESILNSGQLIGGRPRYRNVSKIVLGELKEVAESVNFRRPAWPGSLRSEDYRATAKKLAELARNSDIPFHVPASEILKTVECRISEMFYFTGFYPEKLWVQQQNPLPVWKKIKLAGLLFPEDIFPVALIRDIQNERNIVEHQFAEPDRNDVDKMSNTMHLFLDRTERMISILQDVSMLAYHVEDSDSVWRLQICRDDGEIVLFQGEYTATSAHRIPTIGHIAKKPDYCTMLIQRVLTDIDKLERDPWSFFKLDEVIPDGLGPDITDDVVEL